MQCTFYAILYNIDMQFFYLIKLSMEVSFTVAVSGVARAFKKGSDQEVGVVIL